MSNSAHPAHARELRSEPARPRSTSGQIIHAVLSLASAALLIRVIGMANQIIVTSHFGAGARMDAYVVALSLPTLLAQSLTSVIQCAVTPTYARVRTHESREQISILFSTLLNAVAIGSALLVLLMLLFRRQMILLAAPALDPQREQLALALAPYIFPALLLMLVIGYLQSILNIE